LTTAIRLDSGEAGTLACAHYLTLSLDLESLDDTWRKVSRSSEIVRATQQNCYAKKMKLLVAFLVSTGMSLSTYADDIAAYIQKEPSLSVNLKDLEPTLDKLLIRCTKDHRHPHLSQWTLGRQVDTSLYVTHDAEGDVKGATLQFYLGYDKNREKHFQQCLPVARWLIQSLMNEQAMTVAEIEKALREIEHTTKIKEFREKDRVMYFRYKMASTVPEEEDGYRCFRIKIGGPKSKPSTDT